MIIFQKNDRLIGSIFFEGRAIKAIYTEGKKVWGIKKQEEPIKDILSCYYNGYWIDEYPWTDDTPWKD